MPTLDLSRLDAAEEERVIVDEGSHERFDRVAFALRAVEAVRPARMTVAVCEGKTKLRVELGRTWGKSPKETWAMISVPPTASRQAIALAVSRLGIAAAGAFPRDARPEPRAYALDVLLAQAAERTV
jgi:hypothetical protein